MLKLKRIELSGFKSFAESTVIHVDGNLLGIVGPNGSGKSNILDAVHFVFGEQKPTLMRVTRITDAIFNGTQTHPPVSSAQVSLEFEYIGGDAESALPSAVLDELIEIEPLSFEKLVSVDDAVSYASGPPGSRLAGIELGGDLLPADDGDEGVPRLKHGDSILVSRSVYRDGTSEYFLNSRPISLKTIDRLFSRYQLGRHSTFTINQGEVERKLLASPTELREWLGEASGVAIILRAKESCERKLERAERNLTRVKDILLTLKDELNSLKLQAEDANKAKYLSILLWQLRARVFSSKLVRVLRKREKVMEDRRTFKDRAFSLATTLESLKSEHAELEQRQDALTAEEKTLMAQIERLKEEQSRLMISEGVLTEKTKNLRAKLAELKEREKEAETRLSQLAVKSAEVAHDLQEKQSNLEKVYAELEEVRANLEVLESSLAFTVDELNEKNDRLRELERESAVNKEKARAVESEIETLNKLLSDTDKLSRESHDQLETASASMDELEKEVARQSSGLSEAEKHLEDTRRKLSRAREQILTLEKTRSDLREKLSALRTAHENYEELRSEFYRLEQETPGELLVTPLLDLIAFSREWSQAIASALGECAEGFVSFDEVDKVAESTQQGVFVLPNPESVPSSSSSGEEEVVEGRPASGSEDRRSYESLWDRIHGRKDVIDALRSGLGEFAVCDSTAEGWKLLAERKDVSAVVVRGRSMVLRRGLIKKGTSVKGGVLFAKHSELPLIKDEIERLGGLLAELREKSSAFEREEQRLSAEVVETERRTRNIQALLTEARSALSSVTSRKANLAEQEARLTEERRRLEVSLRDKSAELSAINAESDKLSNLLSSVTQEKTSVESALAGIRAELDLLENKKKALSEDNARLSSRVEVLSREAERISNEIAEGEKEVSLIESQKDEIQAGLRDVEAEGMEVKKKLTNLEAQVGDFERILEKIVNEIGETKAQSERILDEMRSVETSLKKLSGGTTEVDERVWQVEQELNEVVKEIHHILGVSIRTMFEGLQGTFSAPEIHPSDFFSSFARQEDAKTSEKTTMESYPLLHYDSLSEGKMLDEIAKVERALKNLGDVNPLAPREYQEKRESFETLSRERDDLIKTIKELRTAIQALDARTRDRFLKNLKLIEAKFNELFLRLFGGGFARFKLTDSEDVTTTGIEVEVQLPGGRRQNIRALSGGERSLLFIALFLAVHITRPGGFCILDEVDAALDDVNVARFARLIQELSEKEAFIVITHNKRTMRALQRLVGVVTQPKGISKVLDVTLRQAEEYVDRGVA